MTRDEWLDVLATEDATPDQVGRIRAEFNRLGFHGSATRDERLRLTEILADSDPIETTKDLTMGEAGRAIRALIRCRTTQELYAFAEPEPEPRGFLAGLIAWALS